MYLRINVLQGVGIYVHMGWWGVRGDFWADMKGSQYLFIEWSN